MDHRVYNASNSENTTDDGAYLDEELKEILLQLSIGHGNGRQLVVEHEDVLGRAEIRDVVLRQLVYLEAATRGICEVGGDSYKIEVGLEVVCNDLAIASILGFGLDRDAIEGVHYTLVREPPLNQLEVLISPERYVVDLIGEV